MLLTAKKLTKGFIMPFAKNNDLDIYYEVHGKGEPLILIMGLGANGAVWEKHLDCYKEHFQCVIIDNRGVGLSSKPVGPYNTDDMAADVVAVMDELNIPNARVAGISMGGAIAQSLTLNSPERVRALILVSTWAKCDLYAKTVFENFKVNRAHTSPGAFMETLHLWIFATKFFTQNAEALQEGTKMADENPAPQPQYAFEAQCDACLTHDKAAQISQITVPTLITIGDRDIFTPPVFSEYLNETLANSQMVTFRECGHAHHWEDLDAFNLTTLEFLQNN
jgi:pimeloyl-ACP methyl ester carboxylesterase